MPDDDEFDEKIREDILLHLNEQRKSKRVIKSKNEKQFKKNDSEIILKISVIDVLFEKLSLKAKSFNFNSVNEFCEATLTEYRLHGQKNKFTPPRTSRGRPRGGGVKTVSKTSLIYNVELKISHDLHAFLLKKATSRLFTLDQFIVSILAKTAKN